MVWRMLGELPCIPGGTSNIRPVLFQNASTFLENIFILIISNFFE